MLPIVGCCGSSTGVPYPTGGFPLRLCHDLLSQQRTGLLCSQSGTKGSESEWFKVFSSTLLGIMQGMNKGSLDVTLQQVCTSLLSLSILGCTGLQTAPG